MSGYMLLPGQAVFSVENVKGTIDSIVASGRVVERPAYSPIIIFSYSEDAGDVCVRSRLTFIHAFPRDAG